MEARGTRLLLALLAQHLDSVLDSVCDTQRWLKRPSLPRVNELSSSFLTFTPGEFDPQLAGIERQWVQN